MTPHLVQPVVVLRGGILLFDRLPYNVFDQSKGNDRLSVGKRRTFDAVEEADRVRDDILRPHGHRGGVRCGLTVVARCLAEVDERAVVQIAESVIRARVVKIGAVRAIKLLGNERKLTATVCDLGTQRGKFLVTCDKAIEGILQVVIFLREIGAVHAADGQIDRSGGIDA